MTNDSTEIRDRLTRLESRMETGFELLTQQITTKTWERVQEELDPIKKAIIELTHTVSAVTSKQNDLYAAHERFLVDESARKDELQRAQMQALRENTFGNVLKHKVLPVCAGIIAVSGAGAIVVVFLKWVVLYVLSH